tara:strand:+ start:3059 stop:3466 length:408 start_codon:yes stop_codon:yes gene_type:complete
MAKWINFNVVGGVSDGAGTLAPEIDGDNLLLADAIQNIAVPTPAPGDAITATLDLQDGQTCTVICSTSPDAADAPSANVPASADYVNKVKAAINRAITANPGGVKSTCSLPQDTADATAAYDPALRVYWRSFVVA